MWVNVYICVSKCVYLYSVTKDMLKCRKSEKFHLIWIWILWILFMKKIQWKFFLLTFPSYGESIWSRLNIVIGKNEWKGNHGKKSGKENKKQFKITGQISLVGWILYSAKSEWLSRRGWKNAKEDSRSFTALDSKVSWTMKGSWRSSTWNNDKKNILQKLSIPITCEFPDTISKSHIFRFPRLVLQYVTINLIYCSPKCWNNVLGWKLDESTISYVYYFKHKATNQTYKKRKRNHDLFKQWKYFLFFVWATGWIETNADFCSDNFDPAFLTPMSLFIFPSLSLFQGLLEMLKMVKTIWN